MSLTQELLILSNAIDLEAVSYQPYVLAPAPQSLGADLDSAKDKSRLTRLDVLHAENVAQGRDKFKTLKQIRAGNTKNRVADFENM